MQILQLGYSLGCGAAMSYLVICSGCEVWVRLVVGYFVGAANLLHPPPIACQLVPALGENTRRSKRAVLLCRLFYANQRRFFEPGQLHRQIAFGQTCRGFKELEVGGITTREHGEDREPGRFVNNTIQIRKGDGQ